MMPEEIAQLIDHTLLKADATKEQIQTLCEEAKEYKFASVCIHPAWVNFASQLLTGTSVKVCTVIGFPLGASTSDVKAFETEDAIRNGATEIDMVINIGALKDRDLDKVEKDIAAVVKTASKNAIVKVIIETCLLTNEEKELACDIAVKAGAHFVKTSTGFATGGATIQDIQQMRKTVGPKIGVKASGGIRTLEDAKQMIEAGASRIGASAGVKIVNEARSKTQ
jgi:deoxyribose-phosphate aldolase